MKIIISVFSPPSGALGPLTRTIGIGKAAATKGYKVIFCAPQRLKKRINDEGFEVCLIPEPTMFGMPKFISNILISLQKDIVPSKSNKSVGNIWFVLFLMGVLKNNYLKKSVKVQIELIQSLKPDVIFTELEPASFIAAKLTKTPMSATFAKPMLEGEKSFFYKLAEKRINKIFKKALCPETTPIEVMFGDDVLKLIPSVQELDGTDPKQKNTVYVGSLLPENKNNIIDFIPEKNKKYIYVYLGESSIGFEKMKKVLSEVFKNNDYYRCIVASKFVNKNFKIGKVDFVNYIDADSLLPHCIWTICHGGHNTIIQSLTYGVPLIVYPGCIFERRFNAEMVKKSNCGYMGEICEFTSEWINGRLNHYDKFHQNTLRISEKIKALGGSNLALEKMRDFACKNSRSSRCL